MCGICGVLGSIAPSDPDLVERMMDTLRHRGPDGEGRWHSPTGLLGHRRLAIIDVDHGHQPMVSPDGRYALIFNGEIYNYLELRQELIRKGVKFRTFSDTEVLLNLLVHDGVAGLNRLNGMFAFCWIDSHSGEWILARDPFGIKPLYYHQRNGRLVFASEIKALLKDDALNSHANWGALQEYLTFQFTLGDKTLFEDVRKLAPATYLRGRGAEILEERVYWTPSFEIDEHHTDTYFIDRLRSLLEESVHLQIRSDVPLGTYLSGGLDSSIITVLAAEANGNPIPSFHGRFAEGRQYDESPYARTISDHLRSPLHTVTPTAADFAEDLPRLIYMMDEPTAGPGLFPQYRVSRLASQHVKVVLGGQGGDEIFGGYARYLIAYLEQALKGAIFQTQEEGQHIVSLASVVKNLPLLQSYTPLMQHFWSEGLFGAMDARYMRMIDRSPDLDSFLTRDALDRIDRSAVSTAFCEIFNQPQTHSYINKMTHFDMKTLLTGLLQVEDRVSMAVSLESRVPFLDTRIVNLVASMPPRLKFEAGTAKHVLKQAMQPKLPDAVLSRTNKMGFPVPLTEWFKGGPVRDFIGDVLLSRKARERGLFKPEAMTRALEHEVPFGRQIWGALCIELWHQTFIDQQP